MFNNNNITSSVTAFALVTLVGLSLSGCVNSQENVEEENVVILDNQNMRVTEKVAVFKDAMKKQCFGEGIALKTMEESLTNAGVEVFCAERHKDGMVYPQVCGNDEGTVNVFSIAKSNLDSALALGFSPLENLSQANIKSTCLNYKSMKK